MRSIRIGIAQLLVEGGEPERNFQRAEKLVDQAVQKNCNLVLLPETIDFAWTHPSAKTECKSIPGPYSDWFCNLAKQKQIYICVGLTEKRGEKRYNTAILINKQGVILTKYSKINLLVVEHDYYEVGKTLNVIETEFGNIGLNICADNYPESLAIGHTLARMGAQIILSPSSWTVEYSITEEDDPYKEKWVYPLSKLAKLYNIVIVSTTSVGYIVGGPYEGKKMVGCSLLVNKDGVLAQGQFNEFAGQLIAADVEIPFNEEKGTQIGDRLKNINFDFNNPIL
ncbi:MAG: carbon-nitrogen hydrolase family protein [Bacteroidota bacterium]